MSVSLLYNEIAKEGELVLLLLTSIIYYVLMRLHGMSYADMMGYVAVEKELRHGLRAESFSTTSPSKKFYEDLAMSILGAPREWEEYKTILEDRNGSIILLCFLLTPCRPSRCEVSKLIKYETDASLLALPFVGH